MSELSVELWGFLSEDVEGVREEVERLLGVTFEMHESASIGPYYFAPLAEPDFPDFGVLLYVERKTEGKPGSGRLASLGATAQLLLVE